jgi:leucyl-tRNA synthetase
MDTFVQSSWYYHRYACQEDTTTPINRQMMDYWMDVDQYIGGIEHAVMHLLYARFFHKVLRDLGYVASDEPFRRLLTQGMVLLGGRKMSKSVGNVVDPDALIARFGCDTVRLFTLFAAPPEKDLEWVESGVEGAYRFLGRLWRLVHEDPQRYLGASDGSTPSVAVRELEQKLHATIKKVTDNMTGHYHFNTAIAAAMELVNVMTPFEDRSSDGKQVYNDALRALLKILSPFVPHICEELWRDLGETTLLAIEPWPVFDASLATADTYELVFQVNGKVRAKVDVERGLARDMLEQMAFANERVQEFIKGMTIVKVVVVPDKLVNIVVKPQ